MQGLDFLGPEVIPAFLFQCEPCPLAPCTQQQVGPAFGIDSLFIFGNPLKPCLAPLLFPEQRLQTFFGNRSPGLRVKTGQDPEHPLQVLLLLVPLRGYQEGQHPAALESKLLRMRGNRKSLGQRRHFFLELRRTCFQSRSEHRGIQGFLVQQFSAGAVAVGENP